MALSFKTAENDINLRLGMQFNELIKTLREKGFAINQNGSVALTYRRMELTAVEVSNFESLREKGKG